MNKMNASIRFRFGDCAACLCRLLACLLFTGAAFAQYRFDHWTADNGLPQNSIHAIRQARDGYLWLATSDGLVRFDGVRFTVFNKSNSPGLASNRLTCLYEDREGDLWMGTDGAGVTRLRRGVFTTYTTERGLPHNLIRGVTGDEAGNLWVLSANRIMRWEEATGRFLPTDLNQAKFTFGAEAFGSLGGFWDVDRTSLYRFARGRPTSWTRKDGLPSLNIHAVAEDRHGDVWAATSDAGLVRIKDGKVARVYGASDGLPSNLMWFISGAEMRLACADRNRNLHIISLDPWAKRAVLHPPPGLLERLEIGQLYIDITALCEDREGNLWIGTQRRGLYRARKQVITSYSKRQGLVDNNAYPIYEDRAGAIWIGAWYTGLSRFKDGAFTNYTKRDGLPSGLVTAIGEDQAGRLWVAAYGDVNRGGLRVFERGRFTVPGKLASIGGQVLAIFQDRTGALWFGADRGLIRYQDGAGATWTTKDGLAGDEVKVIIEGAAGDLWVGCYGGLSRFKDGKLTSWTERDGLASNTVRALYEDRDGSLWIGSYDGGLSRFKDGRFTRYTMKEGLFNDGVFQILEDARGNFWMSCNRGVYRVNKHELDEFAAGRLASITSIAYGRSDGILNPECNGGGWPAGAKTRDGKLWFPTQDGVAVIDPEVIPFNAQPPPVIIESFMLDRAPVAPLSFDRPVRIAPGWENFEIEYTALSFVNSERLRFKYKLEGLDQDWTEAGTRRTAYYSYVPPGQYVFRVIAANSDGVWNTEGQSLRIIVAPPFYRTWWFTTLVAAGASGLLGFAWRYRVAQFKRAQAAQQAFARQLIESQESERKRIAAELHDSLGQNLLIIRNRALLQATTLSDGSSRSQFDTFGAAISQTLEEVRAISHDLRPPHLDQLGLRTALVAMIERVAASSTIRIMHELGELNGVLQDGDEITLYRIVQESLNNILKHSGATKARVNIAIRGGLLTLTIHDNGRGFTTYGDPRNSAGVGLQGIAERVRILGGAHEIHSALGRGTTVTVRIELRDRKNENPHSHSDRR
ncbi:MAG TPA: two-component regulator propeller domain-containing protein [Blastocatellia bacterium]|nr:two-component regulator propeller domain-containing protein [Blastocatellia bacterium]